MSDFPAAAAGLSSGPLHVGRDEYAYLRACLGGVARRDAAQRYLGLTDLHGKALATLHRQLVDRVQAVARRRGDPQWALLGAGRGARDRAAAHEPPPSSAPAASSFEDWVVAQGWEDWSQAEQLEAYEAHLRAAAHAEGLQPAARARIEFPTPAQQRRYRLQQQQLALLERLERQEHHRPLHGPSPQDPVGLWFSPVIAERLGAAGLGTVGALQRAIRHSACWHRKVKAVGQAKARRIEALLSSWGGDEPQRVPALTVPAARALDGTEGRYRARSPRISARDDRAALEAWLNSAVPARAATRQAYRREVERWWLWCVAERGRAVSSCNAVDCRAYLDFLATVPAHWQSRRVTGRWTGGWVPFRGSLGPQSRRFALQVLHQCCEWLAGEAGYLDHNPWADITRGASRAAAVARHCPGAAPLPPEARVLPDAAMRRLVLALPDPARPGHSREGLLLLWCAATGLRPSELLAANVGDLRPSGTGWLISVGPAAEHRGPRQRRLVEVPLAAVAALEQSLAARGLGPLSRCPGEVPLLAAGDDPSRRPTYFALHRSFKHLLARALRNPAPGEGLHAEQAAWRTASPQWLRHTFATGAARGGMSVDRLRHHLGHADDGRVRRYYPQPAEDKAPLSSV